MLHWIELSSCMSYSRLDASFLICFSCVSVHNSAEEIITKNTLRTMHFYLVLVCKYCIWCNLMEFEMSGYGWDELSCHSGGFAWSGRYLGMQMYYWGFFMSVKMSCIWHHPNEAALEVNAKYTHSVTTAGLYMIHTENLIDSPDSDSQNIGKNTDFLTDGRECTEYKMWWQYHGSCFQMLFWWLVLTIWWSEKLICILKMLVFSISPFAWKWQLA